jgi:hypothetical protein
MRRRRCPPTRPPQQPTFTLGEFLTAATSKLDAALPTPRRRPRRPLVFSPRRGRSAAKSAKRSAAATAPPTAERRAHVQVLRTLGLVDLDEKITPETMLAYEKVFAMPIPLDILRAIAAIVDKEIPEDLGAPACTPAPDVPLVV